MADSDPSRPETLSAAVDAAALNVGASSPDTLTASPEQPLEAVGSNLPGTGDTSPVVGEPPPPATPQTTVPTTNRMVHIRMKGGWRPLLVTSARPTYEGNVLVNGFAFLEPADMGTPWDNPIQYVADTPWGGDQPEGLEPIGGWRWPPIPKTNG